MAKALNLLGCWETIGDGIHAIGVGSPTRSLQKDRAALTHWPLLDEGRRPRNCLQDETLRTANRYADR